jgi:hypothetical protein
MSPEDISDNDNKNSKNSAVITIDELERKIELENVYKSCCLLVDKRALLFFSQLGISVSVLSVCLYQLLTHHNSCESNQMYSNILMMILGVWIPQPRMTNKK